MRYDLVVENGRVIDPESNTDEMLSLGINQGIIETVSKEKLTGKRVIDASGCIVSPGFIDIHAHEDFILDASQGEGIPFQTAMALLRSGVTTMLGGNCGIGAYPFESYLEKLKNTPLPLNYHTMIGYSSLRDGLGIDLYSSPSRAQIQRLKEMVIEGMELGLPGVSFGLQYTPGTTREEMLEIARVVKDYDRFIAVHLRYDYPLMAQETVREMSEIVKVTQVKLQLSHLAANVYGGDNMKKVLALIAEMNERGFDVKGDMYPYDAWSTGIKSAVFDNDPFHNYNFTYGDMEIITGPRAEQRCTAEIFRELREQEEDTHVTCHNATPWVDIVGVLSSPFMFLGSDGMMTKDAVTGEIKGHPRSSGTTARFLRLFVRDQALLDLKTALGKMTLDPANRLQLQPKGRLQAGKDADITIFQLDRLREKGEYGIDICALPPVGIKYVVVGGQIVYTEKEGAQFAQEIEARQRLKLNGRVKP
ncbi:amidohydrolase family protein [Candidatus Formimonas warabiya]|uniref:Amidohydrolase family protein n=1 Tax=Formimonas warabiya TaxID=1761012 RepID=A0A3G1KZ07_FORW1|nr:amidohydrolase family protein [Candidatus Formimonas warabiya]ATW27694.1 hypothetical protein DCMF_25685 [Candidatus Formimonas warabiya]